MEIETLNIIPSDYNGNPRDALGYAWKDLDRRIPGEDITLKCNPEKGITWKDYLKARYGEDVEVHNHNNYGFLQDTPGRIIASVNCMWCGGFSGVVYRPSPGTAPPESFDRDQAGDSLVDTEATVRAAEKIELMEMDERHQDNPGYCTKCHSYCYGDCDA